jgi:hypothetical protein
MFFDDYHKKVETESVLTSTVSGDGTKANHFLASPSPAEEALSRGVCNETNLLTFVVGQNTLAAAVCTESLSYRSESSGSESN